jgi:hypothetical protein
MGLTDTTHLPLVAEQLDNTKLPPDFPAAAILYWVNFSRRYYYDIKN